MNLRGKKAQLGSHMTFTLFVFLLVVAGGGIALGILMFFGQGYEFRKADAEILNSQIISCIDSNVIDDDFFKDFYEICNINKESIAKEHGIKICEGLDKSNCIDAVENEKIKFVFGSNFQICELTYKKQDIAKCSINNIEKGGRNFVVIAWSNQHSTIQK